jgi:ubiquinone/menaquinone biosynthesis C-methylase UbiE
LEQIKSILKEKREKYTRSQMTVQRDPEGTEAKILHQFADFAGKRVLEIGCGEGRLTWKYAGPARRVVGIDLEIQDLRVARIDCASELEKKTWFACGDSIHLPFSKETFDIALLSWSL